MRIVKDMPESGVFVEDNCFSVIDEKGLHFPLGQDSIEVIKDAEMFIIPEK